MNDSDGVTGFGQLDASKSDLSITWISLNPDDAVIWAKKTFGRTLEEAFDSSLVKDERQGPARRIPVYGFPNMLHNLWGSLRVPGASSISHKQRVITRFGMSVITSFKEIQAMQGTKTAAESSSNTSLSLLYTSMKGATSYPLSVAILGGWTGRNDVAVSSATSEDMEAIHQVLPMSQSDLVLMATITAFARSQELVPRPLRNACRREVRNFRVWLKTRQEQAKLMNEDLKKMLVGETAAELYSEVEREAEDDEGEEGDSEGAESTTYRQVGQPEQVGDSGDESGATN